jgi:hypothetical protein
MLGSKTTKEVNMAGRMRHARCRAAKVPYIIKGQRFNHEITTCKGCGKSIAREEAKPFSVHIDINWWLCEECHAKATVALPHLSNKVITRTVAAVAKLRNEAKARNPKRPRGRHK